MTRLFLILALLAPEVALASKEKSRSQFELKEGIHEWQSHSGTLVLVLGSYQDVQRYHRNFTFYVKPGGSNEWHQVPIMTKDRTPSIGWDTAHGGDVTLSDATVVQRQDGIYFITVVKRIENGFDGPGRVKVTWHRLWDAGDNEHDGPAYSFRPDSSHTISSIEGGVEEILRNEATQPRTVKFSKESLDLERIKPSGTLVNALWVSDREKSNVLVMTESAVKSHKTLNAIFYGRSDIQWKQDWSISDSVQCPGLDSEARFFPEATSVTDLDNDGKAEITVAYSLFCGGGVDPSTVKVIMRQGDTKFAIRGESLIRLPGKESIGGSRTVDPLLSQPRNAVFLKHMESIWNKVYIEKRKSN
jgi:hypothetical protein